MVDVKRIAPAPKPAPPPYNPYDPVYLVINGKPFTGRPYEWDAAIGQDLRGPDGREVAVTKVATMCPDCGAGLFLDTQQRGGPVREFTCSYCRKEPEPPLDPFRNPFEGGGAERMDFDLIDLLEQPPASTVAERLGAIEHEVELPDKATVRFTDAVIEVEPGETEIDTFLEDIPDEEIDLGPDFEP